MNKHNFQILLTRHMILFTSVLTLFFWPFSGLVYAQLSVLTDAKTVTGNRQIAHVALIGPTREYQHFVLGRDYEAKGFRATLASGSVLDLTLADGLVFEDRVPRLADMNGDGQDEVILVMSSVAQGAALAIFEVNETGISLLAQTPHIGIANRWLNPAGIADFDGDGRLDIALVQMPHLVKRLELWTLEIDQLKRSFALENVSNHRGGSPYLGLSSAFDHNDDGIADLLVPDGSRRTLRILSFTSGGVAEIGSVNLPSPAYGDFSTRVSSEKITISVPMESGDTAQIEL